MCSEEFSITCKDHHRNVVGALGRYFDKESLVDCVIAAEGKYLKAHRVVLSACSTYFELLFTQEMKEKVVILEDIKFNDLRLLIDFIYEGQVTLPKVRLQDFVRGAEFLQIRGLPSDLVQVAWTEGTEVSVMCKKEGLESQLSLTRMRCFAISGESSDLQCASNTGKNPTGDEGMLSDLSEENMFLHPQSILETDCNRKTAVLPAEIEPSVEPKEEVDVEDTPIWDSEDKNSNAAADMSSATGGEEVQRELTTVPGIISRRRNNVSCPQILERESKTYISMFSSVTTAIPSSTNDACSSLLVPTVPPEQGSAMEDFSSFVQAGMAEHNISVKNKTVMKTNAIPAVMSFHSESVVEPMHAVCEQVESWECEGVITQTDSDNTYNEETINPDLDVAAAAALGNSQAVVWPIAALKAFVSSFVVDQTDRREVNAQEVKRETEMNKSCMGEEFKSMDVNDSTVDEVVESGQGCIIRIEEGNVERHCKNSFKKNMHSHTGEHRFQCEVCEKSFSDGSQFTLHKRIHTGERPFQCEVCGIPFSDRNTLTKHKLVHTDERPFRCEVCEKTFTQMVGLTTHKRIHTGERSFQCGVCEKSFSNKSILNRHKRRHTGDQRFQCEACEKEFSRMDDLSKHKRIHTGERPFHCEVCGKSYSDKSSLNKHKLIHTDGHPSRCDVCEKTFSRITHFLTHKRIHTGECPFQCQVCEKSFSTRSDLTKHTRIHTGERKFQCEVCGKTFVQKSNLITHKRTHTGERPYQCEVCEKTFNQMVTLTTHKRIHTGERPFMCEVCGKSFISKSDLTTHKRIHTGERPFQCEVCEKTFNQMVTLTTHKRIHTGERPFQCEVCEKTFSRSHHLSTHKRIHTGERPFQCEVCEETFSRMGCLSEHKRIHTGERPFQCEVCDKSFSAKSDLTKHTDSHE